MGAEFPGDYGNVQLDVESSGVTDGDIIMAVGTSGRKLDTSGINVTEVAKLEDVAVVQGYVDDIGAGNNFGFLQRVTDATWELMAPSTGIIDSVAEVEHPEPEEGEDPLPDACEITTATPHGLKDGDTVTISGTTDYDDEYEVANTGELTFEIAASFTETKSGAWRCLKEYIAPRPYNSFNLSGTMVLCARFVGTAADDVELIAAGVENPVSILGNLDSVGAVASGLSVTTGALTLDIVTESTVDYDVVAIYIAAGGA
jgi:hypothetical protein